MELKEYIEEFKKCREDPAYFSKYIKVVHPKRGLVPFDLYPFQKRIVKDFQGHRFCLLRKFRQAGCTTLAAMYALHQCIFKEHQTVPVLSIGDRESTEFVSRISIMYNELPEWMKPKILKKNEHEIKFANGSMIKSRPSGKESGRSLAGSLLIVDEAAFIENIETIWAAAYPTLSTGGGCIILSTVNGMGNFYHRMWQEAVNDENEFHAIQISWEEHPEYKKTEGYEHLYKEMLAYDPPIDIDKWEEITRGNMIHRKWLQEYECSFLGTGDTYVDGDILRQLKENENEDYYIKYNNRMRIWKDPEPIYDYVIAVDVSLGRQRDHSAFHIINLYNGEQVAEFYSNRTPINEFASVLVTEARRYNTAYVLIERNTIGNNLIDWVFRIHEYDNLWLDEKGVLGFQTTQKVREQVLATMEELIRTGTLKINSSRTVDELLTFIVNDNGKAEADQGMHDDLVMSLALASFAVAQLLETTPVEFSKQGVQKPPMLPTVSKVKIPTLGGVVEEDIKWLMS